MCLCTTGRILLGSPLLLRYSSLDGLHIFKTSPLDDPLELGKKKKKSYGRSQVNREVFPGCRYPFRPETVRCSAHPVPLLLRHAQIFGDNLSNTFSFSCLAITSHHLLYLFDFDLSPASWKPPVFEVIFYLLTTLPEPLVPIKNTCVRHGVIRKRTKSFWFIRSLVFIAERPEKEL